MNKSQKDILKKKYLLIALLSCGFLFVGQTSRAAWNLPSCNPDSVGPTDASCNVSAPLNVSSSNQTKTGQLTIQNTVNAGALVISNAYSGNGTVTITTSSGKSLNVTHNDGAQSAVTISTNSNQPGFSIAQTGSGGGITTVANGGVALSASTGSATNAAITASNSNTAGTAISVSSSGNTATGVNVSMTGTTSYGVRSTSSQYYAGYFTTGAAAVGALYAQNTSSGIGISVSANSGTAVSASSTSGSAGSFTSGSAAGNSVFIENTSTGSGLGVATGGVLPSAIGNPAGWPASGGQGIRGTSSTSFGVVGYSTANTGYGVGVYGRGTNDYGVVAYSDSDYGLFANTQAAGYYGLAACNAMTANCGYIGGGTYAGNFAGRVYIETSGSGVPVTSVLNTNTTMPYGFGLRARTMISTLTALSPNQGTAVEGQAYNGYGGFFYSENGPAGVYARADEASAYAGQFVADGGSGSAAVRATNTGNAGKGIVIATEGIGIDISTNTTTADATGIVISAAGGQKGIVIDASSTGIDVDTTSGLAIQANDDYIQTSAGYFGGQFYAEGVSSDMTYPNTQAYVVDTATMTTSVAGTPRGLFFDGSDIWVPGAESSSVFGDVALQRFHAYNMQDSVSYIPNSAYAGVWSAGAMVWARDKMYAFNGGTTSTEFLKIDPYDETPASGTFGSAFGVSAAVYDGQYIYLGRSDRVSRLNLSSETLTTIKSSIGEIVDLLYAGGYIWALDNTNGVVYKMNSSGVTSATITVGTDPSDMLFDGASIWVANNGDQTLSRINIETNAATTENISTTITTGIAAIAFDGRNIWIIDGSTLYAYNIKNDSLTAGVNSLSSADHADMIFDGTYLWATDGETVDKISIGGDRGYASMPAYPRGIMMYGEDGNYHCLYFDGAGTLQDSTTLTNCR